jgi:hypothetical protein
MHVVRVRPRFTLILASLLVASVIVGAPGGSTPVAAANSWSQPTVLFTTSGYASEPVLVADQSGDVHLLFWHSVMPNPELGGTGGIMYARLHQGHWSDPVDILSLGDSLSLKPAAAVDDSGYLHVVWRGFASGEIYYSRAHVAEADSARAWTPPVQLSDGGASYGAFGEPSAIAVIGSVVHVAYTSTSRVYYVRSNDGGRTWLAPTTIADGTDVNQATDNPRIAADSQGRVFLTWSQYVAGGWPPVGTYFARSVDGGSTWMRAVRISGADRALLTVATDGGNQVFRMWLSRGEIGQKTGQASTDGGTTWSAPVPVASGVGGGFTGFPAMGYDSLGLLHAAISGGSGTTSGIFATQFDGRSWSEATLVSRGSIGKKSIESPALAISLGNQIHIVWEDDFQRIMYTTSDADAPRLPARAVPLPPVPTPVVQPTPVPISQLPGLNLRPTPTPSPANGQSIQVSQADAVQNQSGPLWPLLAGAGLAIGILGFVVAVNLKRLG